MIAYNTAGLDNKEMQNQAGKALAQQAITPDEHTQILAAYPVDFYTPNIFIRIGLFLLTLLIVLCSGGLLALIANTGANGSAVLLFFVGLCCIAVLEYLVYGKRHFRSCADDALLWIAAGLIFTGIDLFFDHISDLQLWCVAFVITAWCALRFADRIMTLTAYASLVGILFYTVGEAGRTGMLLLPFTIMALSCAAGWMSVSLFKLKMARHYRSCLLLLKAACLITFYAAGNIFVIRDLAFFGWRAAANTLDLLQVFYWIWTLVIPLLYGIRGILKKDRIFLWMGLAGTVAAIATIRYYHSILPIEWAMTIGGALLIMIAYTLIKYLRIPRAGFTGGEDPAAQKIAGPQLESILIAETFPPAAPAATDGFQFGGGSGGGGGAGGQY